MTDQGAKREGWHLDKRVSIALILALVANTAMGAWTAAQIDARTKANFEMLARHENYIERLRDEQQLSLQQGAAITQQINGLSNEIRRVERGLEQNNALLRQLLTERPSR